MSDDSLVERKLMGEIPISYFISTAKYTVINWIAEQRVPARIGAAVLESWANAVGVTLTSTDYELVRSHLRIGGSA